jgi:phytoene synthase
MDAAPPAAGNAFAHCRALVRRHAPRHHIAALMAPAAARDGLVALAAFDVEAGRVREVVREPMAGEVRLQWWRDALAMPVGERTGNPVADAVRWAAAAYRLPLTALDAALEARGFDLYDDPMPSLADLEGYAGETQGSLVQLAAIVLAGGEDPGAGALAGHAGVAATILAVLQDLPRHASRRQMYLPADVLARYGADPEDVFAGRLTPAVGAALAEMRRQARHHLDRIRIGIAGLPAAVVPAFLPLAPARPLLDRMERPGWDPFRRPAEIAPVFAFWRLFRAARRPRKGF